MARLSENDKFVGFLMLVAVGAACAWGYFGLLGLFCLLVVCFLIVSIRERLAEHRERKEPCIHGVGGAKFQPQLCKNCLDAAAQKENERQKEAQAKIECENEERERKKQEWQKKKQEKYQEWLTQIRVPEYVKSVAPAEFEILIRTLFTRMGYTVESTPHVGDHGSDGYLFKDNKKTILQCKRVQGSVGEPILRDLFGAMHSSKCDNAIVVTTGRVSNQAREWIDKKPIKIIELNELNELIKSHFHESEVVPADFTPSGKGYADDDKTCPECGKSLRVIYGRRGRFFGCSGYPGCRFTREFKKLKSRRRY